MKSSKLRNITAVLAKITQIVAFAGAAILLVSIIVCLVNGNVQDFVLTRNGDIVNMSIADVDLNKVNSDNIVPLFIVSMLMGIFLLSVLGMICRNVNRIFKKTNTESPFSSTNVSLIKQIGYLAISIPVVKLIVNFFVGVFTGDVLFGLDFSEVLFGLVILCIAQYFAYGATLEKDVEGLL